MMMENTASTGLFVSIMVIKNKQIDKIAYLTNITIVNTIGYFTFSTSATIYNMSITSTNESLTSDLYNPLVISALLGEFNVDYLNIQNITYLGYENAILVLDTPTNINNSRFENLSVRRSSVEYSGVIYVVGNISMVIENSTFKNNTGDFFLGSIIIDQNPSSHCILSNCTFLGTHFKNSSL